MQPDALCCPGLDVRQAVHGVPEEAVELQDHDVLHRARGKSGQELLATRPFR